MKPRTAWRLGLLVAVFLLLGVTVIGRIGYLNVSDRDFLREQGDAITIRNEKLRADRGVIYDRRGQPLAVSTPVESVVMDPSKTPAGLPALGGLSKLLGLDEKALRQRIADQSRREFMFLRRRVSAELGQQVRDLGIPSVRFEREHKRYYPAGEIASHVVGVTNTDDRGIEGVELAFDGALRGNVGAKRVLRDRKGHIIQDLEYVRAARPGADVTLSIDLRLQYLAYRELKRTVSESGAASGSVVMLDAKTAEVLALVNQPSFNPNRPTSGEDKEKARRNRAVSDRFEPGSTMKPFAMLAALETGVVDAATMIDTSPGWVQVKGHTIKDPRNRGVLSLGEILAYSSQVGITKIALQLPEAAIPSILRRVGIAEQPGLDLPGEDAGSLPSGVNHPLVRSTLAFGYGLNVTPLQLARAYSVLATGGVLRRVSVLRHERPEEGERVVDARIAAQVARMLEGVVQYGTAKNARVPGYRIAGKTGTVRKVSASGGYDAKRHVAFFAGFAPATNPQIVIVVVVDEPTGLRTGGGDVAAPVFGRIAAIALRLLEIPPDGELSDWGETV